MQKRIDTPRRGVAVLFHKDALQFVQRWQVKWGKPVLVDVGWIEAVERAASNCPLWPRHMVNQDLAEVGLLTVESADFPPGMKRYLDVTGRRIATDEYLAPSLLDFLKKKWARLERSKAGKLKKFLAQNTCAKWQDGFGATPDDLGNVNLWDLQDGELARAFEKSSGGRTVKIDDVTKARKWVAANVRAGEKFAAKVLDENGFLDLKHRLRRK